MSEEAVGFIGVGRMGGRMARRLIDAGIPLTIFDTSETIMQSFAALGAKTASSAAALRRSAKSSSPACRRRTSSRRQRSAPAVLSKARAVKIMIDMSTTGAIYAKRIAEGLAAKGIIAVDAPVSGGTVGAERGTLAVMVSCSDETLPRIRKVLEVFGKIYHVGRQPGMGQTMKLLNNLLSATAMAIASEAVVMGVKSGLDAQMIVDVINAGTGRNSATADKIPRCVLPRAFNTGFSIELLNKDVRLCLEEADMLGVPMVVGTAVRQLLAITMASEGPNADMTEIVKPVEKWAGVQVGNTK
jgi:3-hydroxyisobutyrate dehydrogenase-like beta-hydroxyacid dehydrogenase